MTVDQGVKPETHGRQNAPPRGTSRLIGFIQRLGPGLITGASDDDPSGIGTYAVAGASLGYQTLWLAPLTVPMMTSVQFICAKIGLVTGRGLAGVLRMYYPKWVLYPTVVGLLIANTINAGADIGAIAAGINLLVPMPITALIVPISLFLFAFQLWGTYRQLARIFKWLTVALFAYIGSAFFARPDAHEVVSGTFFPTIQFDKIYLGILVAILGTTISPYLFFWQSNQEVEERASRRGKWSWGSRRVTNRELDDAALDVGTGMSLSNVVMYFIILSTAATLHRSGHTEINSAAEAAEALRPLAGNAATVLMGLGLIGTGLLTVPILTTSAAYAVCEIFGWKCTLSAKPGSRQRVLRGHRRIHGGRPADQLHGYQPCARAFLDISHQWLSGPADSVADSTHREQSQGHGRSRQRMAEQRARRHHHRCHVRGRRRPAFDVVMHRAGSRFYCRHPPHRNARMTIGKGRPKSRAIRPQRVFPARRS